MAEFELSLETQARHLQIQLKRKYSLEKGKNMTIITYDMELLSNLINTYQNHLGSEGGGDVLKCRPWAQSFLFLRSWEEPMNLNFNKSPSK